MSEVFLSSFLDSRMFRGLGMRKWSDRDPEKYGCDSSIDTESGIVVAGLQYAVAWLIDTRFSNTPRYMLLSC